MKDIFLKYGKLVKINIKKKLELIWVFLSLFYNWLYLNKKLKNNDMIIYFLNRK